MNNDIFNGSKLFLNIPIQVANDPRIKSDKSVLIFGEIYSMLNVTGAFFMGTEELAIRRRCSEQTVYNCLNELEKLDYIKREKVTNDKGRTIGRKILLGDGLKSTLGMGSNTFEGVGKTYLTQIEQYNRSINNKDNNKENSNKSNSNNKDNFDYKKFIEWFNEITGRSFSSKALFKKYINARLNEGFTKEDIAKVVTFKAGKWKDTEMKEYLRPNTLFALSHFDNYLQEAKEGLPEPQKKKSNTSSARRPERTEEEERLYQLRLYASEHPEIYESDTEGNIAIREELEQLERDRAKSGGNVAEQTRTD